MNRYISGCSFALIFPWYAVICQSEHWVLEYDLALAPPTERPYCSALIVKDQKESRTSKRTPVKNVIFSAAPIMRHVFGFRDWSSSYISNSIFIIREKVLSANLHLSAHKALLVHVRQCSWSCLKSQQYWSFYGSSRFFPIQSPLRLKLWKFTNDANKLLFFKFSVSIKEQSSMFSLM